MPVVTAGGLQEDAFDWDMHETENHPLRGIRSLHALVKSPKDAGGLVAVLGTVAVVVTPRGVFQSKLRASEQGAVTRIICT
ncbi:MAG: hypothetical protein JOZ41_15875 [Chloroflexi bacterium]|nr:hypothetical protein [Chloroflexota bacterium]